MDSSIPIRLFIRNLTIKFLIFSVLCGAIFFFIAPEHYFTFVPIIFIYFYAVSIITYQVLINSHNLSTAKFSKRFMIVTMSKFFGSLIFAILFLILSEENRIPFLVIFIILYFSSLFQLVHEFLKFINKKKSL
ncbi:MAG: hypothetical protein CVT98_00120 [Bacteroidetes bacterium HGW-Bacteroidetes-15]|nr:MAG: hypothetical protein CVT98_00120 [Bacteroidetes bacterium HGW-Bacteroidetes-15]